MSIKSILTALREAIDTKLPADQQGVKTIAEMTTAVNSIETGGGSMEIYKCVSVDTTASTWSGYLAILTDGIYSFADTVTEGLSYGAGYTPVVGHIYNEDATIYVNGVWTGLPADGLVLYVPFDSDSSQAPTGQTLTKSGDVTYADGWVQLDNDERVEVSGEVSLDSGWTFTARFKTSSTSTSAIFVTPNNDGDMRLVVLGSGNLEGTVYGGSGGRVETSTTYNDGNEHFVAWVGSAGTTTLYVDNAMVDSASYSQAGGKNIVFGWYYNYGTTIYLKNARFYERALTTEELTLLFNE